MGFAEVVSHFVCLLMFVCPGEGSKAVLKPIAGIYADASYPLQQQQPMHLYLLWAGEPGQIYPAGQRRTAAATTILEQDDDAIVPRRQLLLYQHLPRCSEVPCD